MRGLSKTVLIFLFSLFTLGVSIQTLAKESNIFQVQNILEDSTLYLTKIPGFWRYTNGDAVKWIDKKIDDTNWRQIDNTDSLPADFSGSCWFSLHLQFDSLLNNTSLAFEFRNSGAYEIYLDGIKIALFGEFTKDGEKINPREISVSFNYAPGKEQILDIHYRSALINKANYHPEKTKNGIQVKVYRTNDHIALNRDNAKTLTAYTFLLSGILVALGLAHLLIFLFNRNNIANLYYFFFVISLALTIFALIWSSNGNDFLVIQFCLHALPFATVGLFVFLTLTVNALYQFHSKYKWILYGVLLLGLLSTFLELDNQINERESNLSAYVLVWLIFSSSFSVVFKIIAAMRQKKSGARIIGFGVLVFSGFIITVLLLILANNGNLTFKEDSWLALFIILLIIMALLGIPISMSVYLARDFAQTNTRLFDKLIEVEQLSAQTLEQQKERQQMLATQNIVLEEKVKERTQEVVKQKHELEVKNTEVMDSINYARTIQLALIPTEEKIKNYFLDAFVFCRAKDIVSGDFYWIRPFDSKYNDEAGKQGVLIAVADCTGHGVPGALMSILSLEKLNEASKQTNAPSQIIHQLHKSIKGTLLNPSSDEMTTDGMDIAICKIIKSGEVDYELTFSGAARPLWIVRNNTTAIEEYKSSIYSIGGVLHIDDNQFPDVLIHLKRGDTIYMTTDGFADQFNEKGKKLMLKGLKEFLLSIQQLSLDGQKKELEVFFENWKGSAEQTDDVLVMALRLQF